MANIKLKHYVIRKGKHAYWMPTPKMRALGFQTVPCGHDGPDAWAIAREWEERYQRARKGLEAPILQVYPVNSVGDAFYRFRRTNEWARKPPRTREDWERGWKYIEPIFGDVAPETISMENMDKWYASLIKKKGVGEAGRAMKTWRALYTVMTAMKLCTPKQDPSRAIQKQSVPGRTQIWSEGEATRLVKGAWRAGYKGLACIIAIAWDTSFSPVDCRTLTPAHAVSAGDDWGFLTARGKTTMTAFGIMSRRTRRLVQAYIAGLDYDLHDDAPIFRTRGAAPGPKGGRRHNPVPFTKGSLIDDFADVRLLVFGKDEKRRLSDMRRTGAVEAVSGGGTVESIAAKMGNSIDQNKTLQKTYIPVNLAAVRAADESRKIGRKNIAEERNEIKKLKLGEKR